MGYPVNAGMMVEIGRKGTHYRAIRDQIQTRISDAYSRLPSAIANKYATSVLACGVQRKDNEIMGVMFQIAVDGTHSNAVELAPHTLRPIQFMMHAVATVDSSIFEQTRERIAGLPNLFELCVIREILVEAVAETGRTCAAVGQDVMGIVLDKRLNTISTVFRSPTPERLAVLAKQTRLQNKGLMQMISAATPWVIAPPWTFFPSIGTPGGWTNEQTGIRFEYSGFNPKPKSGMYFTGQPRRKPPT